MADHLPAKVAYDPYAVVVIGLALGEGAAVDAFQGEAGVPGGLAAARACPAAATEVARAASV